MLALSMTCDNSDETSFAILTLRTNHCPCLNN